MSKIRPVPPTLPHLNAFAKQRGGQGPVFTFEGAKLVSPVVEDYEKNKTKINPTAGQPWGSPEADKEVVALKKYQGEIEAWAASHDANPNAPQDATEGKPEPVNQFTTTGAVNPKADTSTTATPKK
jgi:hypothetical protein